MKIVNKKIVLLGSQRIAIDVIKMLKEKENQCLGADLQGNAITGSLVKVITSDKEHDRIFSDDLVFEYCEKNKIAYSENPEDIIFLQPDIVFSIYYRNLLPKRIIDVPEMGCINLHPSLLPKDRGPCPVYWKMRRGEPDIASTLHYMDEGMDTGDIIDQIQIPIDIELYTGAKANERTMSLGLELFKSNYSDVMCGLNGKCAQNTAPTYNLKFCDSFRNIDWSFSSKDLINFFRAHAKPYAGSIAKNKKVKIIINSAGILDHRAAMKFGYFGGPGSYKKLDRADEAIIIQARDAVLLVSNYEVESGKLNETGRFI